MTQHRRAVLLVEDNIDQVMLVERAFAKTGIDNPLHSVTDGDQAVAWLAEQNQSVGPAADSLPALILLDLKLPRRSGLEVLAWLRGEPRLRRIPVVVLTSSRENADVDRAYDLGANSYLVKPVGFDAFLEMVRTLNVYWLLLNEPPTSREA